LISAELGMGNKGANYILRKPPEEKQNWLQRLLARLPFEIETIQAIEEAMSWMLRLFGEKPPAHSFRLSDRDESGARALAELNDRGLNLAANALAQSAEHILNFFILLRTELAFYLGCLNLHERLAQMREPISFPQPALANERRHSFREMYDVCLALRKQQKVVGNDVNADKKDIAIITGANQGGKSTFLRSIGLSQLMMQCGMFVPAESFSANLCNHLFTHFKREEDTTMESGKLAEELSRMSDIVDHLAPNAMVLLNESFAATNEREGAEIARQIVSALLERRVKIFVVTHLYEFARGFYGKKMLNAIFLRADRQDDGTRTFKLIEREPLQTSYGADLYAQIFGSGETEETTLADSMMEEIPVSY
jgi:DNA mismatch repair ATPase MutS